jgi:hypothetical protein
MVDSFTSNYNFTLPEVGASDDTWGPKLNGNWTSVDSIVAGKAPLASPVLTGDPKAPTPATADNDTSIATTAFVKAQGYLTAVPGTYALLASPVFTGDPQAPTPSAADNDTSISTTAFVKTAIATKIDEAPSDNVQYVRKNAAWSPVSVPPGTYIGDAAPSSPSAGQLWFQSSTGNTFIYYNDGNTFQWVQINSGGVQQAIATDAPSDGNSYFRQDGVWSASIVQFNGGIIAHKGQIAVGYVKQKGTTGADSFVWRVTDDGASGGANSRAKMTLTDAPDTSLNLVGASPLLGFYPGNGGVQAAGIQSINGGTFQIGGTSQNINLVTPTSGTVFVGPRTAIVVAGVRQCISYLGVTTQYGLSLVAENAAGTSTPIIFTYPPSVAVGAISHTTTTTTYGTTSDERLKDFSDPLTGDEAAAIIRADPVSGGRLERPGVSRCQPRSRR